MTKIASTISPIPQLHSHVESVGSVTDYDYVTWYVSNAKQVASYFKCRFGFKPFAYRGPETGQRDTCTHVIRKNRIVMAITCAIRAKAIAPENQQLVSEIHEHVARHGDSIKDLAFEVDDVGAVYSRAIGENAISIEAPLTHTDSHGRVVTAVIKSSHGGDTTHTLINRSAYPESRFLPGFIPDNPTQSLIETTVGDSGLLEIDHSVSNHGWHEMAAACEFYEKALGFHQFWSVDDTQMCTEFSSLKSTVMASANEKVKVPVNEPGKGKLKSQIEEFVEYNDGPGCQHLAYRTDNIIETVANLRDRGVEFIVTPNSYYELLRERLSHSSVKIAEDIEILKELNVLVDFDDKGYLLQLFTRPLTDRPTFFIEVIQRHNHNGFGAGNFKALFESIERDQIARGTSEDF